MENTQAQKKASQQQKKEIAENNQTTEIAVAAAASQQQKKGIAGSNAAAANGEAGAAKYREAAANAAAATDAAAANGEAKSTAKGSSRLSHDITDARGMKRMLAQRKKHACGSYAQGNILLKVLNLDRSCLDRSIYLIAWNACYWLEEGLAVGWGQDSG